MTVKKPGVIKIGTPEEHEIFKAAVWRVRTWDDKGRPVLMELIQDDQQINLEGDPSRNHFAIGYLNQMWFEENADRAVGDKNEGDPNGENLPN